MSEIRTVTGKAKDVRRKAARPPLWLTVLSLTAFVVLIALGVWQIERRAWKLALIDRVEQRVHAPAQPIPSPAAWPAVSTANDEYRHVSLKGRFLHDRETLVQAVTEEGPGYWVLTPLRRDDGTQILVNRGFVPSERRDASTRRNGNPDGEVEITGLLRMSEPKGGFLRTNVPQHNRWYSRDVVAIAAARGLDNVAPFFVDAEAGSQSGPGPIGGLTVVRFPNNHLIYALTWFALAFMLAGRLFVTFGGGLFRRKRFVHEPDGGSMLPPAGRDQMLERSSSRPEDGKAHDAVTLQSQADARSELIGIAPTDDETNRKNMALLIQLRWTAVVGQIVTIGGVHFGLDIPLPLERMGAVIGALVLLNVSSLVWVRHRAAITNNELLVALMLDVAALTAQLYLSGGATNPFTSLFLLQVTLGAVLLDARSTWSLVALTCASFVWLTLAYRPLDLPPNPLSETYSLTVAGMLLGFVLNAVLLVVFVTRINRNLRERDAHLAALRQHAAEQDHIVRMGLLASGAAHELGTPLASLSVILSDWRRMPDLAGDQELAEDLAEMETSLQRCKTIVTGILVSAGEARGEGSSPTTVTAFVTALVDEWRDARSARTLYFTNTFGEDVAIVSDIALKQVIFNVLDNAYEVSRDWVELVAEREGDNLVLSISDRGPGFAPEMLTQLGKPYQSSKGRAGGGLGLFLVVNVVRKLGGSVTAENHRKRGATVRLTLPLATLAIGGNFDA